MITYCQTIEEVCKVWPSGLTAVKKVMVYSWSHTHSLSSETHLGSLCLELSSARINRAKPNTIEMWKNCLIPDMDILLHILQIQAFHVALY